MGQLSTGARATSASSTSVSIVAGASGSGVSLSYNLAGERKSATYANDGHTESYDFDATGHLTNTYITLKGSSSRYLAAARSNDLLGRMSGYTEYNADGSQKFWRTSTYDADSRVIAQNGSDGSTTYNFYASKTATGADNTANVSQSGFGEVAQVVTVGTGPSSNTTTTTTWTSYQYWDDAKEVGKTISGYNPVLEGNNGQWAPGVSSLKYDVNGHLVSATDAGKDGTVGTADDIRFAYITNAQGVVLRRDQYYGNTVAKTHSYYYLNGQAVGDVGNDGDTLKDYAQTLSQAKVSKEQSYKNWTPISSADFDQNWQPVGPSYPGDAAGSYTVKAGDTLQSIAQNIWGDASLWYVLADANGVSGSTALKAGQVLNLAELLYRRIFTEQPNSYKTKREKTLYPTKKIQMIRSSETSGNIPRNEDGQIPITSTTVEPLQMPIKKVLFKQIRHAGIYDFALFLQNKSKTIEGKIWMNY